MHQLKRKHHKAFLKIRNLKTFIDDEQRLALSCKNLRHYKERYQNSAEVHFLSAVFHAQHSLHDIALADFERGFECSMPHVEKTIDFPVDLRYDPKFLLKCYAEAVMSSALLANGQQQGRLEKALGIYRQILPTAMNKGNVCARISTAHSFLGHPEEAFEFLRRAARLSNPQSSAMILQYAVQEYARLDPKLTERQLDYLYLAGLRLQRKEHTQAKCDLFFFLGDKYSENNDDLNAGFAYLFSLGVPFEPRTHLHSLTARLNAASHLTAYVDQCLTNGIPPEKFDADSILETALSITYIRPKDPQEYVRQIYSLRERMYGLLAELHPAQKGMFHRRANREAFLMRFGATLEDALTKPGMADSEVIPSSMAEAPMH